MSYRPQTSSRRKPGRGRGKLHHEKSKRKGQKHRSGGKYLLEKREAPTFEKAVDKTLVRLRRLGGQVFAFSPFSQYFDDWLLSLKSVLSEFESNPAVEVDEEFVKERSQVIADVELKLSERQREEAVFEETTRRLVDQKNLLVKTDTGYSYTTQNLASERKSEIKHLTRRVRNLETELEETSQTKVSIFSPLARRAQSHKKAEVTRKLDATKSELESAVKALEAEQEKLRSEYEKKKQGIMEQVRIMEKKVGGSETDGSAEDRQVACEAIVNAVKALLQRKTPLQ
jgi:hypothetical protein